MADRPIIFSATMVRALLNGRKTQTRRVLKLAGRIPDFIGPRGCESDPTCWGWEMPDGYFVTVEGDPNDHAPGWRNGWRDWVGAYAPGDRLWVREAFIIGYDIDDEYGRPSGEKKAWYRATDSNLTWFDPDTESTLDNPPWRPSIHMPRWASRLTLTVTDVRVQRLQEISEDDAKAEGIEGDDYGSWICYAHEPKGETHWADPRESYRTLWDSIHGPDAWAANPWVCAMTFAVHQCNIDQLVISEQEGQ